MSINMSKFLVILFLSSTILVYSTDIEVSPIASTTDPEDGSTLVVLEKTERDSNQNQSTSGNKIQGTGEEIEIDDFQLETLISDASGEDVYVVKFFSQDCPHSKNLEPVYRSLTKAFPSVPMLSMDAIKYSSLNYRLGVFGFPRVYIFKGNGTYRRYGGNRTQSSLSEFIKKHSKIEPLPVDYVPFDEKSSDQPDIYLHIACGFLVILAIVAFFDRYRITFNPAPENPLVFDLTPPNAPVQHEHIE